MLCAETVVAVTGDPLWVVPAREFVELNGPRWPRKSSWYRRSFVMRA